MVDDLTPDLHMKILHVQGGERSPLDVLLDGEEGQQGEPRIVPEHLENEVRVADLQEGTDVFLAGGQVAVQDAAVAGGLLRQQKRLGGDLLQVQILPAGEGVGGGGGEDDLLRLLQDLDPALVVQLFVQKIHDVQGVLVHHLQQSLGRIDGDAHAHLGKTAVIL